LKEYRSSRIFWQASIIQRSESARNSRYRGCYAW
jgi:hypothetical protein